MLLNTQTTANAAFALDRLRRVAQQRDAEIDLAETALALAVLQNPTLDTLTTREHLQVLVAQVQSFGRLTRLEDQVRALRHVLVVQNHYHGDAAAYDDIYGANLVRVVERRAGLPVALGVVYLHVAEAMGWHMHGLNVPGHFLLELTAVDGAIIIDPFRTGQAIEGSSLNRFGADDDAIMDEDQADEEEILPMTKRDVLLRLQNNIKGRLLADNRLDEAIETLKTMILLAPRRDDLWREVGMLQAEAGNLRSAISSLEMVGILAGPAALKNNDGMIQQLRRQLN